jgi:hypothetical protein
VNIFLTFLLVMVEKCVNILKPTTFNRLIALYVNYIVIKQLFKK